MKKSKSAYAKKVDYNNAYNRSHYKSFSVRYDRISEEDIINWLNEKDSIKEYLTNLIREDMVSRNKHHK